MKINKGKIKNINKKLFAGVFSFMLVAAPFSSCTSTDITEVSYVTNSEGDVLGIDGTVSYDLVKECEIYKIRNRDNSIGFYAIALFERGWSENHLYDIFTKQDYLTKEYVLEQRFKTLEYYLNEFGMVKEEYTEEELKEVLNEYINNYTKNKKLVKGK